MSLLCAHNLCVFNMQGSICEMLLKNISTFSNFHYPFESRQDISIFYIFFTLKCLLLRGLTRNNVSIDLVCDNVVYANPCCLTQVGSNATL